MKIPSSLYAEKIFSEHPIAFWALDDKADYVSLISETNRDLRLWDIKNGIAQTTTDILDEPFPESFTSKVSLGTAWSVLNSGTGAYIINGATNPTLSVIRGHRYVIRINASGHPFWIQTVSGAYSSGNVYSTGVTNGGEDVGEIVWEVPDNAPNTLYYACQYHSTMIGTINVLDSSESSLFSISCVSPNLVNLKDLNKTLSTFAVGAFLYTDSSYIYGFEIGYEYFDSVSGNLIQNLKEFSTEVLEKWIFISETFEPPKNNVSARIVIKAKFFGGDNLENYTFLVNGISFGQWSEEFNASSLGVTPESVNEKIFGTTLIKGVPAKAYGLSDSNGYYLVRNNALIAKNSGIPIVFGATNSTIIQQIGDLPALILPGQEFLNESGKYKDYTFEFWTRINCDSIKEERRIFGNIGRVDGEPATDGLYVKGSTLSLKIGKYIIRHYVGEWYRPLLIHIRYSVNSISLLVNGEQVGEVFIDINTIKFPEKTMIYGGRNRQNDWLGFYSHNDVFPIDLDAVAIYGYKVPIQVAKRRFIYGQGVEFPENINNAYSGSSIFIDFPFSKYAKNYSYPNLGKWQQGTYDNLHIDGNAISFPKYSVPEAIFSDKTKTSSQWLADLKEEQNEDEYFIKLRPNNSWSSTNGHIFFNDVSLANENLKAFYITCKEITVSSSPQTLIAIEDRASKSIFEISLERTSIKYTLFENGNSYILASKDRKYLAGEGEKNIIGIDIQKFSKYYGGRAAKFFGRLTSALIYVGSKKDLSATFTGNIYNIGFVSAKNLQKISKIFATDGTSFSDIFIDGSLPHFSIADAGEELSSNAAFQFVYDGGTLGEYSNLVIDNHIPSYGITVGYSFDEFKLLISADSSWQDYIPLSFFAKKALGDSENANPKLDFIQFNINYPAPSLFTQKKQEGSWKYKELQEKYSVPIQRTYESLDNQLFTGFENYEDLKNKETYSYKYNTSNSTVKTYITFQLLESGANKTIAAFTKEELAPKNGIIAPIGGDWLDTKYEVVDNMIIYPPKSISFDKLAIVTHIEIASKNIDDNPVLIKFLEYASISLSETLPTPIGTRFGNDIYPYNKEGFYFNYKKQNPFSIYKGSTPYLYLTRNSGITIRGTYDPLINRGISIPINQAKSNNFKVIAMQMAIRFDQDFFPYAPVQIFEIQSKGSYIKIYMVATHPSGKRAKIYALNSKGELENGLAFYLNGKLVKDPTITVKEWGMLGIRFANTQEFSNFAGAIRLTGPLTFNTISYYKSTNLQEVQNKVERPWFKVRILNVISRDGSVSKQLTLDWSFWDQGDFLWGNVLIISETSYYGVDPSDIYKIYTGTNKIIIDDEIETVFGDYTYAVAEDVLWSSQVYQTV